jgi:hypothetical protein
VAKCRFRDLITNLFRDESKFKNHLLAQKQFLLSPKMILIIFNQLFKQIQKNFAILAKIGFFGFLLLIRLKNWQYGARRAITCKFWGQFQGQIWSWLMLKNLARIEW